MKENSSRWNAPLCIVVSLVSTCGQCLRSKGSSCENTLNEVDISTKMQIQLVDGQTSTGLHPDHSILQNNSKYKLKVLQSRDMGQTGLFLILLHSLSNHYCQCGFFIDLFSQEIYSCGQQTSHHTEPNQLCKRKSIPSFSSANHFETSVKSTVTSPLPQVNK